MSKKINLKGQRFGRLVVLEEVGKNKNRQVFWRCECGCKERKVIIVRGTSLTSGNTKSCGCLRKERIKEVSTKHGQSKRSKKTSAYKSWAGMLARCYNPNNITYSHCGGRGIKVCEHWWEFENFYEDIGKYRSEGLTLDRINNNGNYEPSNCRWATPQEQAHNTRAKGFCWDQKKQKWLAQITVNYKQIYLGLFDTPEEARQIYIEAKKKYHGVYLNE